jgi:predicted regulator of Ras-like GTPase activity (Roadblock/LC7/MglB family)
MDMFDLPYGMPVDDEIDVSDGAILPFENGSITTYLGRRSTASGHRIVRAGRVVGWIAEPAKGKVLLCGKAAKDRLETLEIDQHRLIARAWTQSALGSVAEIVPEAFEHSADMRGLLGSGDSLERLLSRDLSAVLANLSQRPEVRGGIAVDSGMLIDDAGDLPSSADKLAAQVGETLAGRKAMASDLGLEGSGHWTLHTGDGSLLLAEAGDVALAIWTEADVDHGRLISQIAALMDGQIDAMGSHGEALTDGHVVREGRGGTDAVLSMLTSAIEEGLTGHLTAGKSSKAIRVALVKGVPVAMQAPGKTKVVEAVNSLCESRRVLALHRLPVGTILGPESGNVIDFNLAQFCDELATTRTRSESRQTLLKQLLQQLYGFEIGLQKLRKERTRFEFAISVSTPSEGLATIDTSSGIDDGLRRKLERSELKLSEANQEIASLKVTLESAQKSESAAKVNANEANRQASDVQEKIASYNRTIDQLQLDLSAAQATSENSEARSDRLSKRVNELEHQLSERAVELARILGDTKASSELSAKIEEMATKEASLSSDIDSHSSTLASIRSRIEDDQRRQRMIEEQVEATRDRHRRAQGELTELEAKISDAQLSLRQIQAESKVASERTQDDRTRLTEQENRASMIQSEMRELMDERRQVLKELGDLGARRGQAEAELSNLLDQAEALAIAHEEALSDIKEAELLRAKLSEEPLAQALLEDGAQFDGLGPVLDRLEHARTLGYSVSLLDRAVERALQVIQGCVDHVATTPRHLLSNEVMSLLERQVPQTAGAVRGLARWSVQQRLEHQLGETVTSLVLDLENLLEDYDRSVTMLRRIRNVLEQLEKLGAPSEQVQALMSNTRRPESLPVLARETRALIQKALDDIHLEADMRDAGSAVKLEATTSALEELLTQLDASGFVKGEVRGALWDFKRDGILPFERDSVPAGERAPVDEVVLEQMKGELIDEEVAVAVEVSDITEEWEELSTPVEEESEVSAEDATVMSHDDERATLEEELARLDARWARRTDPVEPGVVADSTLDELEDSLDGIDL